MLAQLERRFELLVSRKRELPDRHRTLRATLDWSYWLLSPPLQRFCSRLSVFRGGWTPAAAAVVCEQPEAADYLLLLRSCSLVLLEEGTAELRGRMLETVREYAAEQLSPEARAELARRHAEYFRDLAEEAEPHLTGPEQVEWLDRLEAEHDNLRAALAWALEWGSTAEGREAAELGLRLGAALWWFWTPRCHLQEGGAWLDRLLALPGAQGCTAVRARALNAAARLLCAEDRPEYVEEALRIWRLLGDRRGMTGPLNSLGHIACSRGDYAQARKFYGECMTHYRELGDRWGEAMARANLANATYGAGDYEAARPLLEASLHEMEALRDRWHVAYCRMHLGNVAFLQHNLAAARRYYHRALAACRGVDTGTMLLQCLEGLAGVAAATGDLQKAARLLGAVEPHREALRHGPQPGDPGYPLYPARGLVERCPREYPAAWAEGMSLSLDQVTDEVLADAGTESELAEESVPSASSP